ncbi:hypothetical protein ES702_02426 [subsurface metagenome]
MSKKRTGESLKDLFKKEISSRVSKSQNVKTLKRQRAKESKRQDVKASRNNRKHTIYLSPKQSRKLRVYAAENDIPLSEVIQKLIDKNL